MICMMAAYGYMNTGTESDIERSVWTDCFFVEGKRRDQPRGPDHSIYHGNFSPLTKNLR